MAYTTINKSSDHFITHVYSGNGGTNNQTSLGMTPDLVWVKSNNTGSPTQHYIVDKVRGDKKYISSNATTAEATDSNTFDLVSGGFNLAGGNGWTNVSGRTYCAWNWKAGNSAGSSNTDGTLNSTVSVNTTAGFSIVTYTGSGSAGATVGHGLGAVPQMIIEKGRSVTDDWLIYHHKIGNTHGLALNNTTAATDSDTYFNDTSPTSTVFTLGNNGKVNTNNGTHVAYCFSNIQGFSQVGGYLGNASTNGPFIFCGFKPAFVLTKKASASDNWVLLDNKRDTSPNPHKLALFPNLQDAQSGDYLTDFLSNGFKIRSSTGSLNSSGADYIYIAFAEAPLVGTNNVAATAK